MRHSRPLRLALVAAVAAGAARAEAQERQIEAHGDFARTTHSHERAWGGGAQLQLTWGREEQPVRLGTSLGADYQKAEHGGSSQTSASLDLTLQPGGGGRLTPYAGGSVSANRLAGGGSPSATELGLQLIAGAQLKLDPRGAVALRADVRPGYVRTQEHQVTIQFGVSSSF